jgi:hypothetical protein
MCSGRISELVRASVRCRYTLHSRILAHLLLSQRRWRIISPDSYFRLLLCKYCKAAVAWLIETVLWCSTPELSWLPSLEHGCCRLLLKLSRQIQHQLSGIANIPNTKLHILPQDPHADKTPQSISEGTNASRDTST